MTPILRAVGQFGLRREERFLTTLEYKYQYQETADDDSWIFRYEYQREPPDDYPYPLAHVHVNAVPESYSTSKEFPRLHLPTGTRVRIEDVVRHLLDEHEVPAISPNWQAVLAAAEADFAEIQKRRIVG